MLGNCDSTVGYPHSISYLSRYCCEIPDKGHLRKEGFILAHSFITAGKVWRQEQEATGHTMYTIRKLRVMNACAQLTFPFLFSLGPEPME